MSTFKCIAELDLGPEASASFTTDAMDEMVKEILNFGEFCVVLKNEMVIGDVNSMGWESVQTDQNLNPRELMRLQKLAQRGNRLAVALVDLEKVIFAIESSGYIRSGETALDIDPFLTAWGAWFEQHCPDIGGALVFGHDWEPIYIFKNMQLA